MLRARLFGPLTLEIDGRAVPSIAGLKPRSVLAWLLLHPGPHTRARLASLFWGEVLDISVRASLRNTLWTIRSALEATGGSAYLDADRDSVGIAIRPPRQVDAEEFDRLAGLADPAGQHRRYLTRGDGAVGQDARRTPVTYIRRRSAHGQAPRRPGHR